MASRYWSKGFDSWFQLKPYKQLATTADVQGFVVEQEQHGIADQAGPVQGEDNVPHVTDLEQPLRVGWAKCWDSKGWLLAWGPSYSRT